MNNTDLKTQLIADFKTAEGRMNGEAKSAVHQIRQQALERFDKLGFPTIRHEEWKYSNVKNLVSQAFEFNAVTNFSAKDLEEMPIPNLEGNIRVVA